VLLKHVVASNAAQALALGTVTMRLGDTRAKGLAKDGKHFHDKLPEWGGIRSVI